MDRPTVATGQAMWRRLPPGFKFHPTDEELVLHYLKRKASSSPLPAFIIPEIGMSKIDPWELPPPGGRGEARYFFSFQQGTRRPRPIGRTGFWRASGKEKAVVDSRFNQVVGMKKVLVFHQVRKKTRGMKKKTMKTEWIMHEYCLASGNSTQRSEAIHGCVAPDGGWVLCRIVQKRRTTKVDTDVKEDEEGDEQACTSLESSCVTELPEACSDEGEEASSRCMSSDE